CFRAETSWLNRSFGGGARRMSVQASVSKVGLGGFTDLGLDKTLCTQFQQDSSFSKTLDYRLASEYTLPYFFSPRNQFNIGVYTERISEPTVYQRQAYGGQVGITHRLKTRRIINVSLDLARVRTVASPVLFCSAFQICIPEQIARLTQSRVRNTLSVNYADDHTDNPIDPTHGHSMRSTVAYATPWLSSSVSFVRWTGEAAYYRRIGSGNVLALSARFGNFFRTASLDPEATTREFVPPEERFFAGGATTVRGYARNQLGGGVYLTNDQSIVTDSVHADFIPTGGTSLGIINIEVRAPSPIFARQLRLAAFVDAGMVGNRNLWHIGRDQWRFTPGVGARATTPVGPIRVDVAYNGYPPVAGPLFQTQDELLVPVDPSFRPSSGGFFSRFRMQVGIGQAF
ncbi:MAG TPA: BamA/TamA family outer membrane protein, partial [Longimicrobiales bacterium]|nr:BamA/TamA family outer membrane protein [Longimicrobiales bacterium]